MSEVLEQSRADLLAAVDHELEDIRVFYLAQKAQLEAQITAQTERANAAEKALADHIKADEGEPPDDVILPGDFDQVFGSSYGGGDESKNVDPGASRLFWNGDVMINDISTDKYFKQAVVDGIKVHVMSWKSHDDKELEDFLKSLAPWQKKGHIFAGSHHHEIENDVTKDGASADLDKFRATTARHYKLMENYGVIPGQIFMQYTLAKASGRDLMRYFVKGAKFVMWDAYINPKKGKDNPEAMAERMETAADALPGVEWSGLGEHGVPNADNTEPVIYELVKRMHAALVARPFMRVNCYWPSRGFEFPSQRVADVWFGLVK